MSEVFERYMNEETIRLFCCFCKNKFSPKDRTCKNCARYSYCLRDIKKMREFLKKVPWWKVDELDEELDDLIEKIQGQQRCGSCEM